jgi:hypothetical protein
MSRLAWMRQQGVPRRWLGAAVAALLACGLLPATVSAAPDPLSCASARAIYFQADVPAAFRTSGSHSWQYRSTYTDADGTAHDETSDPISVAVVPGASAYEGNVLLRFFAAWGQIAIGSYDFDVAAISPTQPVIFLSNWYLDPGDTAFASSIRQWVRYTDASGNWSEWIPEMHGPAQSACAPGGNGHAGGLFIQSRGWAKGE